MIIFGTRGYLYTLAMVNFVCNNCHNPAAQKVLRRVIRFTLFFIPLFPVSSSYSTTCTFCGLTTKINKEAAEQYVSYGQQQQASYAQQPLPEQIPAGQPALSPAADAYGIQAQEHGTQGYGTQGYGTQGYEAHGYEAQPQAWQPQAAQPQAHPAQPYPTQPGHPGTYYPPQS